VSQEEQRDTHETDALSGEVTFDREDVEAVGDPAAASVEPAPGPVDPEPAPLEAESSGDDAAAFGTPPAPADTPVAADRRGAEQAEDPPFAAIAGAFAGAFVAAKLLGRLGGGDD
jgi:hypothetical protein